MGCIQFSNLFQCKSSLRGAASDTHKITLEVIKTVGHGHALLLAFHEFSQSCRYFHFGADDGFYRFLELCRMGCLAEYAVLAFMQTFGQCTIATGTVRVERVSCVVVACGYGLGYLFVGICGAAYQLGNLRVAAAVEVTDTREVARVATSMALAMVWRLALGSYMPVCR